MKVVSAQGEPLLLSWTFSFSFLDGRNCIIILLFWEPVWQVEPLSKMQVGFTTFQTGSNTDCRSSMTRMVLIRPWPPFMITIIQIQEKSWPTKTPWAASSTRGPCPEWVKDTTYLDVIFQVLLGPGIVKLLYFQTLGRRWTNEYNPMEQFAEDSFVDDETEGIIGEYRDIELSDSHSVTVG